MQKNLRCKYICWAYAGTFLLAGALQAYDASTTQTLSAQVDAYGTVSIPASAALTTVGHTFANYSGALGVNYRARTSAGSGSGSITVQAVSDFSPSNGPTLAGGALTIACGAASLGQACSGTPSVSASSATTILTLPAGACTGGGGACSAADPNTMQLNFNLTNKPVYKTGSYTIQLTFTVSSI